MSDTRIWWDKSNALPEWQIKLIDQILNLFAAYYCLPEKVLKEERRLALEEGFRKINQEFKVSKQSDPNFLTVFFGADMPAGALLAESKFIELVNKDILLKIDAHLKLDYHPDLISRDSERGKGIIIDEKNQCAYFESVILPPPKRSQDEEKKLLDDAEKEDFGFLLRPPVPDEPFICMENWEKDWIKQIPDESHVTIPDNIGYIRINAFHGRLPPMQERADALMRPMINKKAIILDLRYHVGGDPLQVQEFESYFFQQTGTVVDRLIRPSLGGAVEEYRILEQPFKLLKIPVYILISKVTCSAGEALAYNLQQMERFKFEGSEGRFTLIGQTTAGGGHSFSIFPLVDFSTSSPTVNKEILLLVPIRFNENAFSHTNWEDHQPEGKGVHPDIKIEPNESALERALVSIKQAELLKTGSVSTPHNMYPPVVLPKANESKEPSTPKIEPPKR